MRSFSVFRTNLSVILAVACLLASACVRPESRRTGSISAQPPTVSDPDRDLPFGNPSRADAKNANNYLLVHGSYSISYNSDRGTLNWVAWRTKRSDLADSRTRAKFEADPTLPREMKHVQYYDYSGSGYDRGHMVPSADRFADEQLNRETFLMTNIVPQSRSLNQFPWNKLESYARSLVFRGAETYTIAGVYGEKERLKGKVAVPTNCWKVIVVFDRGESDSQISARTRVIAVDMPNNDDLEGIPWDRYTTTIDEIERRTGYDLFDLLPDDVENVIESRTSMRLVADR